MTVGERLFAEGEARGEALGEARGKAQGEASGREQALRQAAERMSDRGMSAEEIADLLAVGIDQVRGFLAGK